MNEELEEFYIDSFQMGVILYDFFGPNHPCHKLVSFIVENKAYLGKEVIPNLEVVCNTLSIPESEVIYQLSLMKSFIDGYINGLGKIDLANQKGLSLPINGTLFMARKDETEIISFRSNQEITLQIGDLVRVAIFPEFFKGKVYFISQKLIDLTYSGLLVMYHLREVEHLNEPLIP